VDVESLRRVAFAIALPNAITSCRFSGFVQCATSGIFVRRFTNGSIRSNFQSGATEQWRLQFRQTNIGAPAGLQQLSSA
jgi:hypothetical protein